MRTGITGGCLIRKGSGIVTTQEKLRLEECRILTCSARDFLARHSQSLDGGKDLQTQGEPCSLKLPDWLIFSLKTYPDCFRMTKAGRFTPSSVRFMNWGIMWSGRCLTARILESRSREGGYTLSDILMEDVPEKYFLSPGANGAPLIQVIPGAQGKRVYHPDGVSCTLTSSAGGMGGKTGLYEVGIPIKEATKKGYMRPQIPEGGVWDTRLPIR